MFTTVRATVLVLLVVVLSAGPVSAAPATRSADEAPVTWGVVPSGPDGPNGRDAFTYTLDPGDEIADVVGVVNYAEAPLSLRVYASDAVRSSDGGFDLLPTAQTSSDVGAWTRVGAQDVTVPPRSRVDVPFRIAVPANATPGDHAGGIVASLRGDGGDDAVSVERRVGARIYARITGTLNPSLAVSELRATVDGSPLGLPGEVRLDYVLRNDGNLRLAGRPLARVTGPFGLGERLVAGERLAELKPGDSIRVTTVVPGMWQLGRLTAEVTVTPEATGDQELRPHPAPVVATAKLWAVPWIPLAALAFGVLAMVWWHRRRARRKRTPGPHQPHSSVDSPSRPASSRAALPG